MACAVGTRLTPTLLIRVVRLCCVFWPFKLTVELVQDTDEEDQAEEDVDAAVREVTRGSLPGTVDCLLHYTDVGNSLTPKRVFVQIEATAMAAEATEAAWRLLSRWLIHQWDNRQCAEDWSGLLGSQVDGALRLSMCTLLRAAQIALRGTADAPLFDALPLAHGGTIGGVLEDLVVAEGVCGSVAHATTKRLDLAIESIVERGGRVNARSVQEALRTVPIGQVELHKQQIGIRVWNLLQVESLRVYSVDNRCAASPS